MPGVLLPGGDHDRRVAPVRVEDPGDPVRQAGRDVKVDQRGSVRRLRIAVGRADGDTLLEAHDELEPVSVLGELVEDRQLGRAGVGEEIARALAAWNLEKRL